MMRKKILLALFAALVCCCTPEAEKEGPRLSDPAKAPQVVSSVPVMNASGADIPQEIVLTYDKPIALAPHTTISINGVYVDDNVYILDNQLFIPVSLKGGTSYALKVQSPSVKDAEGNYAADYVLTFSTSYRNNFNAGAFSIEASPADADATEATRDLYSKFRDDFGKKIYSASSDVAAWTGLCGQAPAIGEYADVSAIGAWDGIFGLRWLPAMPTQSPDSEEHITRLEFDDIDMGEWAGYICFTMDNWNWFQDARAKEGMDAFQNLVPGSSIVAHYKDASADALMALKDHNWGGLVDASSNNYEYFSIPEGNGAYTLVMDEVLIAEIKSQGMIIGGKNYTLTYVEVIIPSGGGSVEPEKSVWANAGSFFPADAVTPGTWQNTALDAALAALAQDLKTLAVPVLFRPFPDASAGKYWWGGGSASDFKALWKYTFDYLCAAGVHNLLWTWSQAEAVEQWYPGDSLVDFTAAAGWDTLTHISISRMPAYCMGALPPIGASLEDGALWIWCMPDLPSAGEALSDWISSPYIVLK